jgi:hypothetical protein
MEKDLKNLQRTPKKRNFGDRLQAGPIGQTFQRTVRPDLKENAAKSYEVCDTIVHR